MDDRRIVFLVKKTVGQIKNTLQEVGVSTIKRKLHQRKYIVLATRCKPSLSHKNRKTRLMFAKKHFFKKEQFWKNILWVEVLVSCNKEDFKQVGRTCRFQNISTRKEMHSKDTHNAFGE